MTNGRLSTYTITLLIIFTLIFHVSRKENRYRGSYEYFRAILIATGALTTLEMISWMFDGVLTDFARTFNIISNYLVLYASALPVTFWFMYFDYRSYFEDEKLKLRRLYYLVMNLIIATAVTMNFKIQYLFEISAENHYVGHYGASILGGIQVLFILTYIMDSLKNRKIIHPKIMRNIALLAILPVIGIALQTLFYGGVFIWPMMTYVCLYTFLLIEREEMTKDPLTGLALRSQMETRINNRIRKNRPFSLIMLDLDGFKSINDSYGHVTGDRILVDFSAILTHAIRKIDTAYRYAGDEFILLIETDETGVAQRVVDRILEEITKYNSLSSMTLPLGTSFGVLELIDTQGLDINQILGRVDELMYSNKREKKG